MADFNVRREIVNGMSLARGRGYGHVTRYLEQMGVPRSSAYRWEADLRWLIDFGPSGVRELQRECEKLRAQLARWRKEASGDRGMSRRQEWAFLIEAVVRGNGRCSGGDARRHVPPADGGSQLAGDAGEKAQGQDEGRSEGPAGFRGGTVSGRQARRRLGPQPAHARPPCG